MNSEERVINTLQRKEVDRIPTFEWSFDKKLIDGIFPGCSLEDFIDRLDIDAVVVELYYKKEEITPGVFKDEWGNIIKFSDEFHALSEGCIRSDEDFKKFEPPEPLAFGRFDPFEKAKLIHGGKRALVIHLNDVFSIPRNLLGYENLFINIAANPKLVKEFVDMSAEFNLALAREAVKRGAKIVFTGDDYAYDKGLLISPKSFDEIFYPGFLKVIKGFKELGLLVIKHTDGYIWPIIDKLIDSGIDCLDPIEPTAGMLLSEVKKKYGSRIALKGNVDCSETLTFSNVDAVVSETKKCIKDAGEGYGYVLSSSNSIHSGVKPENYKAMLDTLHEYGSYPIKF
ncbi:MAG: uroporphyrinogen decarboxylase family protein [Candidatus Humimicrobiaceae bacterium]